MRILSRPDLIAEIVRLRESGMTYAQISKVAGVSSSAVYFVLVHEDGKREAAGEGGVWMGTGQPRLTGWDLRRSLGRVRHRVPGGGPRSRSEKHDAIIGLRRAGLTMEAIGEQVGLTRERVRQVLVREERGLGETLTGWLSCERCGKHKMTAHRCRSRPGERPCRKCGQPFLDGHWAYCPKCRDETRACDQCGSPITRRPYYGRRSKMWFCGRECLGRYAGTHYGFRVHPEYTGSRGR